MKWFVLLLLAGCTFSEKRYVTGLVLPTGERVQPWFSPNGPPGAAVFGLPGLELRVEGDESTLGSLASPYPFPPLIPFDWRRAFPDRRASLVLAYSVSRAGWSIDPTRLRLGGHAGRASPGELEGKGGVHVEFDLAAPLEADSELDFADALRLNGAAVELPPLRVVPHYEVRGGSVP